MYPMITYLGFGEIVVQVLGEYMLMKVLGAVRIDEQCHGKLVNARFLWHIADSLTNCC